MKNMYFNLFANCFLTQGQAGSIIMDAHRRRYLPIDNQIATLLAHELQAQPVEAVYQQFPQWQKGLDAYLTHFVEHDYGFFSRAPQRFPAIDTAYHHPGTLHAAIIVIDDIRAFDYQKVFGEIMKLGGWHFQLLLLGESYQFVEIQQLLGVFQDSVARSVELSFKHNCFSMDQYRDIVRSNLRCICTVYGESTEEDYYLHEGKMEQEYDNVFLRTVTRPLDYLQAEPYAEELFNQQLLTYIEAQSHNTGLHKKVCIDPQGEIKNYFTHAQSFGNIGKDSIAVVVQAADFQQKWHITNDQIARCSDCQFRYMCVSNSDIIKQNGRYMKTETCAFDPYTNSWN